MILTVRLLGREVLHVSTSGPPPEPQGAPDFISTPVGFDPTSVAPLEVHTPDRDW